MNLCGRPDVPASWRPGSYLPSGAELARHLAQQMGYPDADTSDLLRVSQYVDVNLGIVSDEATLLTALNDNLPRRKRDKWADEIAGARQRILEAREDTP